MASEIHQNHCRFNLGYKCSCVKGQMIAEEVLDAPQVHPPVKEFDCSTCHDKGFVNPEEEVVPCPACNEDGMDEVTG